MTRSHRSKLLAGSALAAGSVGLTVLLLVTTAAGAPSSATSGTGRTAGAAGTAAADQVTPDTAPPPSGCDPLDPTQCLLPFPDNYFTVRDPSTATGRRVDFPISDMPQN